MERWSNGAMEQWSGGAMEQWSNGAVERWSNGAMELGAALSQRTGFGVAFDLDGGVLDSEGLMQVVANFLEECVALRSVGDDKVRGERILRRAHRPNM
jgi:hypothetical protein